MKGKPVTDLQIRQAKASEKRQCFACGGWLYVMFEPISKASNSKSFIGKISSPSGREGKQIEVRIGAYGKVINKYSLKEEKVGNHYVKFFTPTLNEFVELRMKFKQSSSIF